LRYHSAIQPRIITNTIVGDTLKYLEEIKITQQKKPGSIKVFPLVDLGVRGQNNLEYRAMAGVQMEGNFGRKVYTRFSYLHGIENGTGFFREKTSIGKTIKN
jgi:hypothetical protein